MLNWTGLRVLCLGGAGQVGMEICRKLDAKDVALMVVHDVTLARSQAAVDAVRSDGRGRTQYVASGGNLFHPADLETWEMAPSHGPTARVCHEIAVADPEHDAERLLRLVDARLGALTPETVKRSLIWNLVEAYRPHVVVDTINTATVVGYQGDVIQSGRNIGALARRILEREGDGGGAGAAAAETTHDLVEVLHTALQMTASLDTACVIRFVQCLHAVFKGDATAVPGFERYVKVHTTGLGGMGFNIRYTHGDTGEPGLSTKLLGKVCATGALTQLLATLAHTPGCDVRVVVPGTLIGFVRPEDMVIRREVQRWEEEPVAFESGAALPLVDASEPVPCDGRVSLRDALKDAAVRLRATPSNDSGGDGEQRELEVPYLSSGENRPYAAEDIAAVTSPGQMGCITKEEVSRAVLECIAGDSRYDVLTALDAAVLLPTHTAAAVRDRELQYCRAKGKRTGQSGAGFRTPSISLGNLGPTTAKYLFEIEIIRATYGTVERVAREGNEGEMTLRACSYIQESDEGRLLRRQILSLGLPIFLRKGPAEAGLLLGSQLLFPDPRDQAALDRKLDPSDPTFQAWLEKGWIDLTGPRMKRWHGHFVRVHEGLRGGQTVSRNWFDPAAPFTAGQFLAYLHSISGGERKQYM